MSTQSEFSFAGDVLNLKSFFKSTISLKTCSFVENFLKFLNGLSFFFSRILFSFFQIPDLSSNEQLNKKTIIKKNNLISLFY